MTGPASSLLPESLPFDPAEFDFDRIPGGAGVFLLETGGEPFIGKSAQMRRRLLRLLGPERTGKRLNLRETARVIHYRPTGSVFETSLLLYRTLREVFPGRYQQMLRLRVPPLLKLNLANPYPRCYVTRRLTRSRGIYYGPFPNRAAADKCAAAFLDQFLVRRCVEAIHPDPKHPGCIYGEMKMCLRPCQAVSTEAEYRGEVDRLAVFLSTSGTSLVREIETQRDRLSEQLDFEGAAQMHKRIEKVRDALKQRPDLATDLDRLHGLVVQRARSADAVELFPVWRGFLLPQISFSFEVVEGKPVSMDARLREALAAIEFTAAPARVRGEHLALLARWYYRGTRKGEFVPFESWEKIPFRRLVNAVNRVAHGEENTDEHGN